MRESAQGAGAMLLALATLTPVAHLPCFADCRPLPAKALCMPHFGRTDVMLVWDRETRRVAWRIQRP